MGDFVTSSDRGIMQIGQSPRWLLSGCLNKISSRNSAARCLHAPYEIASSAFLQFIFINLTDSAGGTTHHVNLYATHNKKKLGRRSQKATIIHCAPWREQLKTNYTTSKQGQRRIMDDVSCRKKSST
eukprot:scaffold1943_cov85-Skeletonema_dohrnii-CCMP3373.AAC.3